MLIVIELVLAACTTSTVKATGVVTGYAEACLGPAVSNSKHRVKVSLYSGSSAVASMTIWSGATYRFSVAPGYVPCDRLVGVQG